MLPRIIHYCWFGHNKKPASVKKYVKGWKRVCPQFQIIEWNEENFDITKAPLYVQQAYQNKKWAFVTDYVRLFACYNYGGYYFDTDVELIKPLDDFENTKGFFCFENDENVATGLGFGVEKNEAIILDLMKSYENIRFINPDGSVNNTPCPQLNKNTFLKYGLIDNGQTQTLTNGIKVLHKSWFAPLDYHSRKMKFKTENTHGIHHYDASWYTKKERINYIKRLIKNRIKSFLKMNND